MIRCPACGGRVVPSREVLPDVYLTAGGAGAPRRIQVKPRGLDYPAPTIPGTKGVCWTDAAGERLDGQPYDPSVRYARATPPTEDPDAELPRR